MLISWNLFFTVLLWIFFLLILLSNRENLLNRLCFCSGMLFSLGTFKEYFYYDLIPWLEVHDIGVVQEAVRPLYSTMTSILYLCAMPSAVLFSVYFCELPKRRHVRLSSLVAVMLIPAALCALAFPPTETYVLQRASFSFWLSVCLYNLIYGALFTWLMVSAVLHASMPSIRRQKKLVASLVLPLVWYWLITIFVFHTLQLHSLLKLWIGNAFLVAIAICVYLYTAFHEGIMGVRLNAEHYRWEVESETAFRGAQFMSHALKHDLTKLAWCAQNLSERYNPPPPEADIVAHAVDHLAGLQAQICLHTGALALQPEDCTLQSLLDECGLKEYRARGMVFLLGQECGKTLLCDRRHTAEVIRNLLDNAWEGAGPGCSVRFSLQSQMRVKGERGRFDLLTVADNGPGMSQELRDSLFQPYLTDKTSEGHMGLGLFYCAKVMRAHGGGICAENAPGSGCVFRLHFPCGRLYHGN